MATTRKAKPAQRKRKAAAQKPGVIEMYPYKGGYRLRFIGSNGKILNHEYDTPASARRGVVAMEKLMKSYVLIRRKPEK